MVVEHPKDSYKGWKTGMANTLDISIGVYLEEKINAIQEGQKVEMANPTKHSIFQFFSDFSQGDTNVVLVIH